MNVQDFTYLLQNPSKVTTPVQAKMLDDIIQEYPYFQAARALHVKGLKNLNSFKYSNALKVTAAYTTDRDILFDFITSEDFLQNTIADTISGKTTALIDRETISEEVEPSTGNAPLIEASNDLPLPQTSRDADELLHPQLFRSKDPDIDKRLAEKKLQEEQESRSGAPKSLSKRGKYSFGEWLQLTSSKATHHEEDGNSSEGIKTHFSQEEETLKKKKFELIDKFIEQSPKIVPQEEPSKKINIKSSIQLDKKELMTETLAKVYLEQKKYKKAIQAYKILSLKYPEKSGSFADRIKAVEKIQQENK